MSSRPSSLRMANSAVTLLHISLILLKIQEHSMKVTLLEETDMILKIGYYLQIIRECNRDEHVAVVSAENNCARDIVDAFLNGNKITSSIVLFDVNILPGLSKQLSPETYYIFVAEFKDIMRYFKAVVANYSATYLMVTCHNEWNKARLTNILMQIWADYRILDFALVSYNKKIEIVSYNPFTNKTIHFSGDSLQTCALFPYKLSNLYRHTLKVSMFSLPPMIVIKDGKIEGKNARTINIIAEKLNAQLDIVVAAVYQNQSSFVSAKVDVLSGKAEFSLMPFFASEDIISMQRNTYPLRRDDLLVVTRNYARVFEYSNMYQCFDVHTWIILAVIFITVALLRKIFSESRETTADAFLHTWAVLFNSPLLSTFNVNRKTQLVFSLWILCSMVISACFNSSLLRNLVKPSYKDNINSIKKLRESNLNIVIPISLSRKVPMEYDIADKLITVPLTDYNHIFEMYSQKSAVALKETILESYLDDCIVEKREIHILQEHLVPGLLVHYFPQRSPFKDRVSEIIQMTVECGLTKLNHYSASCKRTHSGRIDSIAVLTVGHYKIIFTLFLICHSIAIIVFIFEIFKK